MAKPIWFGLSLEHVFDFYFDSKPLLKGSRITVKHNGHIYKFDTIYRTTADGCILWEDIDINANINFLLVLSFNNKCTIMIKDKVHHTNVTLVESFDISQMNAPCARLTCRSGEDLFIIHLE